MKEWKELLLVARARLHEHGEKRSKYFLNLGKRNNIKKHVRKLYLSGSFSTDPFEILNAEKFFYSKLYSRQRVNLNSEQAKSSLENPNILKLSDELSSRCEGKITFQQASLSWVPFKRAKRLEIMAFQKSSTKFSGP